MVISLSVASAIQLCAGCTVTFETLDTLGAADDPAGVGLLAEVLPMKNEGYLVSSQLLGGEVIVYDSAGRYSRMLTREGEGPGELRGSAEFAIGVGGILIHELRSPVLHLFSSNLEFKKTFRAPGVAWSVQPDQATEGWLVSYTGGGDGPEGGVVFLDRGGNIIRSMKASEESGSLRFAVGDAVRGPDGMIWTASYTGLVEVFDDDLRLLGSLQLEGPGLGLEFDPSVPTGRSPPAIVTDIHFAADGSVWVFVLGPATPPPPNIGDQATPEELIDTFIHSVRMDSGRVVLVGTARFDNLVRPLGDEDLAYDLVNMPDGDRRVRLGRLRLSRQELPKR